MNILKTFSKMMVDFFHTEKTYPPHRIPVTNNVNGIKINQELIEDILKNKYINKKRYELSLKQPDKELEQIIIDNNLYRNQKIS